MSHISSVSETTRHWATQRQIEIVFTSETQSTNDDAKKNALKERQPLVLYVTAHQTAGRGRGQNMWLDTGNGEGLLSTWSMLMDSAPQAITGPRIGLALFNAADTVWPSLEWSLKAPNDLYLSGSKIAGLLVETVSSGEQCRLLIGLGMNVLNHPRRFQDAKHLGGPLQQAPEEGEWFQFLDQLRMEFSACQTEIIHSQLSDEACLSLASALNANSARPYSVQKVTPQGDLIHAKGKVNWTDL